LNSKEKTNKNLKIYENVGVTGLLFQLAGAKMGTDKVILVFQLYCRQVDSFQVIKLKIFFFKNVVVPILILILQHLLV